MSRRTALGSSVASLLGFAGLAGEVVEALTGGAREALPFIIQGVTSGLSANAIGEALKEAGLGIRRANLLTLVGAYRGSIEGAEYQAGLSADELPPPGVFTPAATFMRNPFAYVLTTQGVHPVTGAPVTGHITISSATALTNEQIEEYAGDILDNAAATYHGTLESFTIDQVLVDPRYLP